VPVRPPILPHPAARLGDVIDRRQRRERWCLGARPQPSAGGGAPGEARGRTPTQPPGWGRHATPRRSADRP
jgi:hypothetical protein